MKPSEELHVFASFSRRITEDIGERRRGEGGRLPTFPT